MIINVINLLKREKRKFSLIRHLDEMNCLHKFWAGVEDDPLPFVNISRSHKQIIRDAKLHNYDYVFIAEDDLRFSSKRSLDYFLQNMPDSFDLYFGMIYTGNIEDGRIVHGFSGMQFYCASKKFYDTFLSIPENKHIDVWLGQHCHEYELYCCDPFICYGESGYSDNFRRQWTFDEKSLPRNLLKDDPIQKASVAEQSGEI